MMLGYLDFVSSIFPPARGEQGVWSMGRRKQVIGSVPQNFDVRHLRVVAEGVETLEQMKLLQSKECEEMQGFWFSRPLAAEEAIKLLPFDYSE